jgi:S-layer homology domain
MLQKLALALLLSLVSTSLAAQPSTPAWGVDDLSTHVVTAWDMQVSLPSVEWAFDVNSRHRYITAGSGSFVGVVHLPQGAQIVSMELEGCDESGSGSVSASFSRFQLTGLATFLGSVGTGFGATPGCVLTAIDLAAPVTIENNAYRYIVSGFTDNNDGTTTIGAVRFRYRLQVSPPPADASFGDVPTSDPAFQFIEALAASGITVGCGGGNYCPDEPLTRRQMAVFLAKALGLHWPDGPLF